MPGASQGKFPAEPGFMQGGSAAAHAYTARSPDFVVRRILRNFQTDNFTVMTLCPDPPRGRHPTDKTTGETRHALDKKPEQDLCQRRQGHQPRQPGCSACWDRTALESPR
jgi:hypothetical protein